MHAPDLLLYIAMRAHGMVYFLFNAHQNDNYCIPEGLGSATLSRVCMKGAGHETRVDMGCVGIIILQPMAPAL